MVAIKKSETPVTATSPVTPMSCTLPHADLKRAATIVNRIADRKSTMPMLANALIRVADDHVLFVATDLNLSVTIKLDLVGSEHERGGIAVPAKLLHDTIKGLPVELVTLKRRDVSGLTVSSANVTSALLGASDRDYPKIADDSSVTWHRCEASEVADLFERALSSVCKDETRFHLNGVLYQCTDGEHARVVSTDGHRLTKIETTFTGVDNAAVHALSVPSAGVIVPDKAAREIVRLLADGKRKGACELALGKHIHAPVLLVRYGNVTLATKLIDAQFPPYEQVIPEAYKILATFERKPLIAALKRAKVASTETRGVKLSLAAGKLTLTSDHPDLGSASETLPMESLFDKTFAIGVNAAYLLDALDEIDCTHVTIGFGDELAPMLVRSTHDAVERSVMNASYLCVVMPMRI
jgi:DNA polymerase III subunit beta